MATSESPSWRPLPVSGRGIPPLLVSTAFSLSPVSYSVHITDLAHVWVEKLDRKGILLRALQEETSIDPSDDPENNFKELLRWIGGAFDSASAVHGDTRITLSASSLSPSSDDVVVDLALDVTCKLPSPLKPLKWPMRLKHGAPSSVTTQLILPLIQAQQDRTREVNALLAAIKDKDTIISRLLDKLEHAGAKLEHIFTSLAASGKKKISREFAQGRIRGLAPFDEAEFRDKSRKGAVGDGEQEEEDEAGAAVHDLVRRVFGGSGLGHRSALDGADPAALDGWWKDIGSGSGGTELVIERKRKPSSSEPGRSDDGSSSAAGKTKKAATKTNRSDKAKAVAAAADDDDDDDFEVQSTPPPLMSARKGKATAPKSPAPPAADLDDDSTASENDDDDPSQIPDSNPLPTTAIPSKKSASKSAKPRRMGAIGKKKQPELEPEPEPEVASDAETASEPDPDPPSPADVPMKDDGSETASDPDETFDEPEAKAPTPSPPPPSPPPPPTSKGAGKRKGGMGRIGRAARAVSEDEEPEQKQDHAPQSSATMDEDDSAGAHAEASAGATPRKKMGRIGRKGAAAAAAAPPAGGSGAEAAATDGDSSNGEGTRGRKTRVSAESKAVKEEKEKPRETSEERADRRREELRKQLEKKAAAGPAKKKRKF